MLLESTLLSNWLFGWIARGKIPSKDLKKTAHRHTNQQIRAWTHSMLNQQHILALSCRLKSLSLSLSRYTQWCQCVVQLEYFYTSSMLLLYSTVLQFYFQIQRFTLRRYFFYHVRFFLIYSFVAIDSRRRQSSSLCSSNLFSVHLSLVCDCDSYNDRNRISLALYAYGPQRHFARAYYMWRATNSSALMHVSNTEILWYITVNDVASGLGFALENYVKNGMVVALFLLSSFSRITRVFAMGKCFLTWCHTKLESKIQDKVEKVLCDFCARAFKREFFFHFKLSSKLNGVNNRWWLLFCTYTYHN